MIGRSLVEASSGGSHVPTIIDGNNQFTSGNGVSTGTGTQWNPYIIEGWNIHVPANWNIDPRLWDGIRVQNTTAYFVIRNVHIDFENAGVCGGNAVVLQNVTNARVEESVFTLDPCAIGILVLNSSLVSLERDGFSSSQGAPGILATSSKNITIVGNTLSAAGISLESSRGVLIHHNNFFVFNAENMRDDATRKNLWDDGYPSGGNYWYRQSTQFVDKCSGPLQDVCNDPDGISDSPVFIGSDTLSGCCSKDRYPLMNYYLFAPDITPPNWSGGDFHMDLHTGIFSVWTVTLSWSVPSDPYGVAGYKIYSGSQCASLVAVLPGNATSYTITNLGIGTSYFFRVEAGDPAGNWSSCGGSADFSFSTPSLWQAYWYVFIGGGFAMLSVLALDEKLHRKPKPRIDAPSFPMDLVV